MSEVTDRLYEIRYSDCPMCRAMPKTLFDRMVRHMGRLESVKDVGPYISPSWTTLRFEWYLGSKAVLLDFPYHRLKCEALVCHLGEGKGFSDELTISLKEPDCWERIYTYVKEKVNE